MPIATSKALTVSELTASIRNTLECDFSDVWVEGEVSNLRIPSSGHFYFTLKDQGSQIRAVLFKRVAIQIPFELRDGLHLIVRGRVSVYEPRGEYQIVLDYVEPKGIGALQVAFEQLKEKLDREGLFNVEKKRALPFLPRCVALVTSSTGAAIRDMVTILRRRCPVIHLVIFPVRVQGLGAADEIAQAVREAGQTEKVDVIIVGRGGGTFEDLWCFNEEILVRAIASSPVPVVSAVGHEIDFTLSDFAADFRAPTPSAAAEVVSPSLRELLSRVDDQRNRLESAMTDRLRLEKRHLIMLRRAIPHPKYLIQQRVQRVDEIAHRLTRTIRGEIAVRRPNVLKVLSGFSAHNPQRHIRQTLGVASQLIHRLHKTMPIAVAFKRNRLQRCTVSLSSLNPLSILSRGYSILETYPGNHIVRNADDVRLGDRLHARLANGYLLCTVDNIHPKSSSS